MPYRCFSFSSDVLRLLRDRLNHPTLCECSDPLETPEEEVYLQRLLQPPQSLVIAQEEFL